LALSLFDSVGRQFATRGDRITIKDKQILTVGAGGITPFPLSAPNIGPRGSALLGQFTRWRFVKIVFRIDLLPATGVTTDIDVAYVGVLDDFSGEGGSVPIPTTADGVLALRCSTVAGAEAPAMLQYNPVDKDKWYYVQPGASGADGRFIVQCSVVASTGSTSRLAIAAYYVIEAEGAVSGAGT
jgi:hypothetical protein